MYVRQKKNASGKICVQVIDKSSGKYRIAHTVGSSENEKVIERYVEKAKQWIKEKQGTIEIDFSNERTVYEQLAESITSWKMAGLDLLLGGIFDGIGFNKIDDSLFRYLVYYRLVYPYSKLKTTEFLMRYHGLNWSEDSVYRYMDKLHGKQKEEIQAISFQHTLKILGGSIKLVFYDVTTLYFEIDLEDELRKTGFSKDGKAQHPQIVLGLLVSENGYPLAYDIFEGNKFEGHTMLPVIESFKAKYEIENLVIVADAGLLSKSNVDALEKSNCEFIIGARLKNESNEIRNQILNLEFNDNDSHVIENGSLRLVVSYSSKRARKDEYNRKKGLRRLEKLIKSKKLTKASLNNRGYNKFLSMSGEVTVTLNEEKIQEDQKWDGLKGYLTNSNLSPTQIITNYGELWKIEKAFRIAKNELKLRPVFHRLQRRIEAHICITFASYKVYKELERQLREKNTQLSPRKAIEIAMSIIEIQIVTPTTKEKIKKLIVHSEEQKQLIDLFGT